MSRLKFTLAGEFERAEQAESVLRWFADILPGAAHDLVAWLSDPAADIAWIDAALSLADDWMLNARLESDETLSAPSGPSPSVMFGDARGDCLAAIEADPAARRVDIALADGGTFSLVSPPGAALRSAIEIQLAPTADDGGNRVEAGTISITPDERAGAGFRVRAQEQAKHRASGHIRQRTEGFAVTECVVGTEMRFDELMVAPGSTGIFRLTLAGANGISDPFEMTSAKAAAVLANERFSVRCAVKGKFAKFWHHTAAIFWPLMRPFATRFMKDEIDKSLALIDRRLTHSKGWDTLVRLSKA